MDRVRTAWTVVRRAIQEARDDDVATMARALAYALFLAIPATALVVLGVFSLVADASTVESLIELPAPMTHASVADSPLAVSPALARLSIGIENADDLRADLEQAFAASAQ